MKITVKLYGGLKKHARDGQSEFILKIDSKTTFKGILINLSIPEGSYVALVDGRRVMNDAQLKDGATLVLFPPVSGG
mgnify:CR=1 FL=1